MNEWMNVFIILYPLWNYFLHHDLSFFFFFLSNHQSTTLSKCFKLIADGSNQVLPCSPNPVSLGNTSDYRRRMFVNSVFMLSKSIHLFSLQSWNKYDMKDLVWDCLVLWDKWHSRRKWPIKISEPTRRYNINPRVMATVVQKQRTSQTRKSKK